MHGFSVADGIAALVRDATEEGKGNLVGVKVKVGSRLFHDLSELHTAWGLVTQDTPMEGVELVIDVVYGRDCVLEALTYD